MGDKRLRDFLSSLGMTIPNDLKSLSGISRLELLDEAIKKFHSKIPFQNLFLMSVPKENRRLPSVDELIDEVASGRGGLCYTNNTKLCLEAVGFEAYHIAASVSSPHSHIITLVKNVLREGDCFIVEVGTGYPSFSAIELDFKSESPVFKDSFCTYKLVKTSDFRDGEEGFPIIERWQKVTGTRPVPPADFRGDDESWFRFYHFTLKPRQLDFFPRYIGPLYEESTKVGPFHDNIRVAVFPDGKAATLNTVVREEGGVAKRKLVLTREKPDCRVEKEEFNPEDEAELLACIEISSMVFPVLKEFLKAALYNYRRSTGK